MKYQIAETGEVIEGDTPLEVMEALKAGSLFTEEQDMETYLDGFRERFKQWSGRECPSDPIAILECLIDEGYLVKL